MEKIIYGYMFAILDFRFSPDGQFSNFLISAY
jgi:hypothetical protein